MLTKIKLLESIKQLPDQFSVDQIIDRIILLDKIDLGLQQSENGQVTRDEDMAKKLPEWLS